MGKNTVFVNQVGLVGGTSTVYMQYKCNVVNYIILSSAYIHTFHIIDNNDKTTKST